VCTQPPSMQFVDELRDRLREAGITPTDPVDAPTNRSDSDPASREFLSIWGTIRGEIARRFPPSGPLSQREELVLTCILLGLRDKEIAEALNLSISSAKSYVHRLLRKTGKYSRQELIRGFADSRLVV